MTQRWGHHSAEGNKSSSVTPMKSSTLRYLCRAPIWASVFWFVFWFEICGSFTCSNTERARKRHEKPHDVHKCKYTIRVIIVSKRWEKCNVGFPLLWLGTLRRISHVHMYTFPTTIHQKHFIQPVPFILCSACRAQEFTFVNCRWYLGFWLTHHYSFFNHDSFSFLDRGLCDMSSIEVLNTVWSQLSIKIYHNNIVKRRIDAKNWVQTNSRLKYSSFSYLYTGCKTRPCAHVFPFFLATETWVHLDSSSSRALAWQLTQHYVVVCTDCLICPFITVELEPALPETCFQTWYGWLGMHDAAIVQLSEMGVPLQMYSGLF